MVEFTRRKLMASSAAAAIGIGAIGTVIGQEDSDTPGAPRINGDIKRLATTAHGAEVTGPFVFDNGEVLFSLQHPSRDNPAPYDTAAVGVLAGHQFTFNGRSDEFDELEAPRSNAAQERVQVAGGEYDILVQEGDAINGGDERWGHPKTPDGTDLGEFVGSRYGDVGYNPDMNFFVSTDEEGLEGYLFTNNETSPGCISRTPISRGEDGWEADHEHAMELENLERFREIGGTRINCYGDLSPWETPMSSEEDYSHPRVSGAATVSDIVDAGSGVGLRGAAAFWNRPNPTEIGGALDELFDDSWSPQGTWALGGVEMLAYYLGADPIDQDGDTNTTDPIGDVYPNPYRYGHIVEVTDPTAAEPTPVKHHVMGRAAFECPEFLPDERTVYLASDGANKGLYKFVAEDPIPSYDDRMNVRGTLYAVHVTNDEAATNRPPAEVDLEIEWIELGTASNAEVESWIADYDDVTQVDYLETHAETDWEADLETALAEADETVAVEGNRNYITDEDVLEWARQHEERGPDGVDEDLRRVPFLETRAAAKEIGATVEFRKAEGIDSLDDAEPGDFLYIGISELNNGMSDDEGDIRMDRVDGGVVYRAELEEDYNVSTLEPVVVGPDATDAESTLDAAPINVDNVMVIDDGRVLLCEDKGSFGRSYPNDALWVYEPPAVLDVDSVAISHGSTGEADLTLSSVPDGLAGGRVTVSVDQTDVAEIVDASYHDALELTAGPSISADGSSVEFRFADLENEIESGGRNVTVATLELEGIGTGTADITVDVHELDDDSGMPIEPQARPGVVVTGPPAIGGGPGGRAPTDPDGDGRFEDVNGNGRLDYDDVVVLFEHIEADSVQLNDEAFDFNENGRIDYDDAVALYDEL
ncbi:alkaline phosphatase PhoX [Natronorubrum halophilum]|uniref:alkaline phosphatase PhoX n=1 Tax=Natronorubrum halophilum TaxID=1702106 RepID=UPI0010C1F62F|nr:alkaline phosphatase PhoX [Natronorubrum halophilum]